MSSLGAALQALPMTFALYAIEALAAVVLALPLGLELAADGRASLARASGRAVWLDRVHELAPALRTQTNTGLCLVLLLVLLSPWLKMAWLHALSRPTGIQRALGHGARLYLRALTVTIFVALLLGLSLAPLLGLGLLLDALLSRAEYARLHDLVLAGVAIFAIFPLWLAHLTHDLACARALAESPWSAVAGGLRSALTPRVQLAALLLASFALSLRWAHVLVAQRALSLDALSVAALLQACCLLSLFVRSLWLARALACAEQARTSGDIDD